MDFIKNITNVMNTTFAKMLPAMLLSCVFLIIAGIDIYLPALPYLTDYFQTNEQTMQFSIVITPVMAALLCLFWGNYSDKNGRRLPTLLSILFFGTGAFLCIFATNIEFFLFARFIQSIGSGGLSVLAIVILSDMFQGPRYAKYLALYGAMFPVVFAIAPIVGAQIFTRFGWEYNFVFITVWSVIFFTYFYCYLPETLVKKQTTVITRLRQDIVALFKDHEFIKNALGHALPVSISILFTANASFIFIENFCFSPVGFSIAQAIPICFNFTGAMIYKHYVETLGLDKSIRIGAWACLVFACAILPGLVFRFESAILTLCIMSWFMIFLSYTVAPCATKAYESKPDNRGLAISLVTVMRNTFASIIVIFSGFFFTGTTYPMFTIMAILAFLVFLILQRKPSQS